MHELIDYTDADLRAGFDISPLRQYCTFEQACRKPLLRHTLNGWARIALNRRKAQQPSGYVPSHGTVATTIARAYERLQTSG